MIKALRDENNELKQTIAEMRNQLNIPDGRENRRQQFIDHALERLSLIPKNKENSKITNFPLKDKIS